MMRSVLFGMVAIGFFIGGIGCGGDGGGGMAVHDAGPPPPVVTGGSGGGTGAAGGGGTGKDLSKFEGVWSTVSATQNRTCQGQSDTFAPMGNITWSAGSSSDLIQTDSNDSCVIHANVSRSTASEAGAQTCTLNGVDANVGPYTATLTTSAYTFVLAPDGQTATENASGTIAYNFSTGESVTCTLSSTASYMKQ
jgi:hypothetical protein